MINAQELEHSAALQIAGLMAAAARTSPKTRGIDNIRVVAIEAGPDRERLASRMRELAVSEKRAFFGRDADCISACPVILLVGVEANPAGLNCGYCGHSTCAEIENIGGVCAFNSIDLGIAASSAVATAADCRVDTRVMFSVGRSALSLDFFEGKVTQALGIPVSITGKSPFFDRK